jgi:hypothetical protein
MSLLMPESEKILDTFAQEGLLTKEKLYEVLKAKSKRDFVLAIQNCLEFPHDVGKNFFWNNINKTEGQFTKYETSFLAHLFSNYGIMPKTNMSTSLLKTERSIRMHSQRLMERGFVVRLELKKRSVYYMLNPKIKNEI